MTDAICLVLLPGDRLPDGRVYQRDHIYETILVPAIEAAELRPLKPDADTLGGALHGALFERLLLCDFAIVDLCGADLGIFYQLGIRHAARPASTLALHADGERLPFDVGLLHYLGYQRNSAGGVEHAEDLQTRISTQLTALREQQRQGSACDSPIFQLLPEYRAPDKSRFSGGDFTVRAQQLGNWQQSLREAIRGGDSSAIDAIADQVQPYDLADPTMLAALLQAYRSIGAWRPLLAQYQAYPAELKRSPPLRQLAALAHNKLGEYDQAIAHCEALLQEQDADSETLALIARAWKDRWRAALAEGATSRARGALDQAIGYYRRALETDLRESYPAINLLTLLVYRNSEADQLERQQVQAVLQVALQRQEAREDYWDQATRCEAAVLYGDMPSAEQAGDRAVALVQERWMAASTANNLRLIAEAKTAAGEHDERLLQLIRQFDDVRSAS